MDLSNFDNAQTPCMDDMHHVLQLDFKSVVLFLGISCGQTDTYEVFPDPQVISFANAQRKLDFTSNDFYRHNQEHIGYGNVRQRSVQRAQTSIRITRTVASAPVLVTKRSRKVSNGDWIYIELWRDGVAGTPQRMHNHDRNPWRNAVSNRGEGKKNQLWLFSTLRKSVA
ncbi:hypothetical protein J6590_034146 [Homalodisca vitripennis]|nr:hypothetical protein J6590_034146 [Homalodisca vitripennis]